MKQLHNVNFFVKFITAMAVMAGAWVAPNWKWSIPIAAACILFLIITRVPGLKAYIKGVCILILLVMTSWCINLYAQGLSLQEALPIALRMSSRLVATTAAFYFVMETSTPGSILAAASAARLPPIATLVLSLTFGVIPMLREDFNRIADAQRARGMEIDDTPFYTRLRFALARGVPLLVQAIRMAHAISLSLSIYGFDLRKKRTTWRNIGFLVEPTLPIKETKP